jgi:hypothetical protein
MLMDNISRCPCVLLVCHSAPRLHDGVVHVLEDFMFEAGAIKGRDLWLEVRRIRLGAPRYRPRDVVWLDFMAPHRRFVVDVTVTSPRTNTFIFLR